LEEPAASIFYPDEEGSRVLRKIGTHLPDHIQVYQNLVLRNYFAKFQQCFLKGETVTTTQISSFFHSDFKWHWFTNISDIMLSPSSWWSNSPKYWHTNQHTTTKFHHPGTENTYKCNYCIYLNRPLCNLQFKKKTT
jgi:hypothetical protein